MTDSEVKETSTPELYGRLCGILDDHAGAYDTICDLLRQQREALKDNDLPELESLLRSQQEVILQVAGAEERRRQVQSELVDRLGLPAEDDPTLQELEELPGVPGEYRSRLTRLRERVVQLTDEARRLNEENRELVQQALQFISYSINEIRNLADGRGVYGDGGRRDGGAGALMMDRRY